MFKESSVRRFQIWVFNRIILLRTVRWLPRW